MFACPNCQTALKKTDSPLLYCEKCQIVFPIKNEIYIILANDARNFQLEYPLIQRLKRTESNPKIRSFIDNTLMLLAEKKDSLTWEWQDEQFWTQDYQQRLSSGVVKNWRDRLWQREPLVERLLASVDLHGKAIVDVGCGEGQTFRYLLAQKCTEQTLYVGLDVSFEALKLNQLNNPHKNSIYILCSADYQLPLEVNSVDVLCYFGILHHTKNKTGNIPVHKSLLKEGGFLVLVESLDRKVLVASNVEESAHEEQISEVELLKHFKGDLVLFRRGDGSLFYTFILRVLNKPLLNSKGLFKLTYWFDCLICSSAGRRIGFLGAGEVQLLVSAKK
jgi:ubiquinone/menaquinone biosynthesis C-methylase UbiE/uncharacterized protein YbaR (Trm112 family)